MGVSSNHIRDFPYSRFLPRYMPQYMGQKSRIWKISNMVRGNPHILYIAEILSLRRSFWGIYRYHWNFFENFFGGKLAFFPIFPNFPPVNLENLMWWRQTDFGFGFYTPKLVKSNHQTSCAEKCVDQCYYYYYNYCVEAYQ